MATAPATPVGAAVYQSTSDSRVRQAMLLGALLEGGSLTGPWQAGDNGLSWGPFQIYKAAHPDVTRAQAEDPVWAVRYMLPSYAAAVNRVSAGSWEADPKGAAALSAYYAERPKRMYLQKRIDAAWSQLAGTDFGGAGGPVGGSPGGGSPGGAPVGGSDTQQNFGLGDLSGAITGPLRDLAVRVAFVGLGLALITLGSWTLVQSRPRRAIGGP
ncbi:MAG TPA: hypothetical protein VMU51_32705 [Mycobacteriales bacterium]|nr:hypothetical protein [Mycobacteriales bacterium]